MKRQVVFLVCALLVLASFAATFASAQKSVECDLVWDGASNNNDLLDCVQNTDRIRSQWKYYVWPGFAALLFLFVIFGISIICCYRCCGCCCCSYCCVECVNPQDEGDRASARCSLWMWVIFAILWACGVCVLIIFGADLLMRSASDTLDDLRYNSLGYFNNTKNSVQALLVNSAEYGTSIDISPMYDIVDKMDTIFNTVKNDYFKYFKIVRIVSYCVGAVGVVLIILIVIFAACRTGCCCSVGFSFVYAFFAFLFSLLAIVFTVIFYVLTAACGEVRLQYTRNPGIMQWYLIPWCENAFDLESLHVQMKEEVVKGANSACSELRTYCDPTDETYDITTEEGRNRIFMCGKSITSGSDCPNLDTVVEVINSTYAKPVLTSMLCSQAVITDNELRTCTLVRCTTECVDYTHPSIQAKTWSLKVVNAAQYAQNASRAFAMVEPLMSCQYILDNLVANFEDPYSSGGKHCSDLRASSIMLAAGFFVGTLMFIMGIYVLHRGSWIWPQTRGKDKRDK